MKPALALLVAAAALGVVSLAGLTGTEPASATQAPTATPWVDPPSRDGEACMRAAWPYASATCAGGVPTRTVRVVPIESGSGSTVPTMVRLSTGRVLSIPLPRH